VRLQFGDCILDRDTRRVTCRREAVHLTPKAFTLLELLLDQRPRVVRKSEIHRRLWPDCQVSATTLTALVAELRRAIGDDAAEHRLIRTVHAFGYAFQGTVATLAAGAGDGTLRLLWTGGHVELGPGEHTIGRAADCVVRLRDRRISRHHARVIVGPAGVLVEDCHSHNGTRLNGTPVHERRLLHDQDVIDVGGISLAVDFPGTSSASTVDGS
jgi:DNA-binding winged helix-turn-helix (wHTH) protein